MKRKIISFALALVLCVSPSFPAKAASSAVLSDQTIAFTPDGFKGFSDDDLYGGKVLPEQFTTVGFGSLYDRFEVFDVTDLEQEWELVFYLYGDSGVTFSRDTIGIMMGEDITRLATYFEVAAGETLRRADLTAHRTTLGLNPSEEERALWEQNPNTIFLWFDGIFEGGFCRMRIVYDPTAEQIAALYDDGNVNARKLADHLPAVSPPPPEAPSSWAAEQVSAAIAAKLVPQDLQSKYTQATTRAEYCALAVALYENVKGSIPGRSTFTDTDDVNVQKAAAIGVVTGVGDGRFDPAAQLTREQAAVMLSRLADAIGKPLAKTEATFSDNNSISSWAIVQVGQIQAAGIMGGVGNNTFAPKDQYTREQSIITMMRLFDLVN